MAAPGSRFRALDERDVHRWRSFRLVQQQFEAPNGERFDRTFLRHPGAVAVVPLDGEDVILVCQYRAAVDRDVLEIPAGTLDKGGHESAEECARRELAEEIGATAARIVPLASYGAAVGISDEWMHLFVATGLRFGERAADGLEEQEMAVVRMPVVDALAAVASGEIVDAKTIIGLLMARDAGSGLDVERR